MTAYPARIEDPRRTGASAGAWPGIGFLALVFLTLGLRAIGAASPTTDEPGHYRYGYRILRGVAARWDDSKMPISALNALPCFLFERAGSTLRDGDEFSGPCDWTLARAATLAGGLALGLVVAAWSRSLFGWAGALVSFGLFALDPNLLAHSTLITTDIFGVLFVLLALWGFARWLENPGMANGGLLGLAMGAAFVSKYTAGYLPVIFVVVALACRRRLTPAFRTRLASGMASITVTLVVINLGFLGDGTGTTLRDQNFESPQFRRLGALPLIADIPLPVPRPFVEGLDRVFHRERNGGGSGNIYFLGEVRAPGSPGFPAYFLVLGFFKSPLPTLLALGAAAGLLLRNRAGWTVSEVTLTAAIVVFSLYFNLLFRAQIGLRHVRVVGAALWVLAGRLGPVRSRWRTRTAVGVLGLGLTAASVLRHGDDPLSYFNELIPSTLTYRIAADSNLEWGQSESRVAAYLLAHPEVRLNPAKPFPGRLLVSANQLTGVVTRKRMEWLRNSGLEPVGHVAFTHFLFELTDSEAARLRETRGELPLSVP